MAQLNSFAAAWNILRVLATIGSPDPDGTESFDHSLLGEVLTALDGRGSVDLTNSVGDLDAYLAEASLVEPDELTRSDALAFWINVYNAGALRLAGRAQSDGMETVLRVPGAFSAPFVRVKGEELSLDAIEHAKVRRFRDPRVHGALVCGAVSCPTLRSETYEGVTLDAQLNDQVVAFLRGGGAVFDDGVLHLSRIFNWFGSDFVRPHKMPTLVPSPRRKVVAALRPWLEITETFERIEYRGYDWGLRCSVGPA